MKMSDWFTKDVILFGDTIEDEQFTYAVMSCEYKVNGIDAGEAICHAINNHDRLTSENERLREALLKIQKLQERTPELPDDYSHDDVGILSDRIDEAFGIVNTALTGLGKGDETTDI